MKSRVSAFYLFPIRFIALPYMTAVPRPSGPASQVYYLMSTNLLHTDLHVDYHPGFRRELSEAFCHFHFLKPHSIVRSQVEERPLADYLDMDAYHRAVPLYQDYDVCGPIQDQQRSIAAVNRGWRLNLRDSGYVVR